MANSSAIVKIGLDADGFEKGVAAVFKLMLKLEKLFTTAFSAIGNAFLNVASIADVKNAVQDVISLGEQTANAGHAAQRSAGQWYLLNNAINKGISLKTATKLLGDNAAVLDRSADVLRDVSIKLFAIGEKVRGFWLGLMDRVAPVLSRFLDGALANSLVNAGEQFGDAIAKALKVIYQTAADGKLWDTFKAGFDVAFDYAAERLRWFGELMGDIFEAAADSFADALERAFKKTLPDLGSDLTSIKYGLENKLGFISDDELVAGQNRLDRERESRTGTDGPPFASKLSEILKRDGSFLQSKELQDKLANLGNIFQKAIDKYDANERKNPTEKEENNFRRAATGVSSLQSIGGGGGVFIGLSVLEVNQRQLKVQEDILRKLSGMPASSYGLSYNPNSLQADSVGITRMQTQSVVPPPRATSGAQY